MTMWGLALKSLLNRKGTSFLTVLSVGLSVALLLTVETVRKAAEEGFTSSIAQVDLVVGARSGPVNLILFSVFNIGSPTNNVSMKTYTEIQNHPAVEWTIPISLGDSHQGYRVVGTDESFYKHYRFRGDQGLSLKFGSWFEGLWDVVIGSEVAQNLKYQVGSSVTIAHGVTRGKGILHHDDKPFKVVGVLKPTGTPIDQSLYVSLRSIEAIHLDWKDGAMPTAETQIDAQDINPEELEISSITAFFLRTRSRIQTLRLQRELNEFSKEALSAVIPGVVLSEIWRTLGAVERALRFISWAVICIGLVSMLIALLTSLQERRREMSVFRALGARFSDISFLIVWECTLISVLGVLLGVAIKVLTLGIARAWIETQFGFYFSAPVFVLEDLYYSIIVIVIGFTVGWIPALRSSQLALKDGLIPRV